MRRKLTLAALLSLVAASPPALALGVGEVDVRSTLNAPLRATLPLSDTAGLEPGLLKVSVAESRDFEAAGLNRTPLAASVALDVRERQGQWVVEITSERAAREPWVDLMLRFDWPGGRQLREVTLLLDPVDYDQMPVLAGAASASTSTVATERSEPATASQAAQESARPVVRREAPESSRGDAWVGSGDTLWSVAGRLRPDSGISMDQMMVALVEANPDAFPSGNINAMRAGHTLVVPSRDMILARSDADADRIVAAMNQAWANRGGGAPARVPLDRASPQPAVASVDAQAVDAVVSSDPPPSEDAASATQAATDTAPGEASSDGPRLTLLTDAQVAAEAAVGESADDTSADASGAESAQAKARSLDPAVVAQLGNPQLALISEEARLARLEQRWRENRQALEAVQEERDTLQAELGSLRDELDTLRDQLAALMAGGGGREGAGAGGVSMPDAAADRQDAPWWGMVYQADLDRHLLFGGAGIAALLGLWLLIRRRRAEAVPADGSVSMPTVSPMTVQPGQTMAGSDTASPMGPASPRPAVPTAMPQAEAISEADIFLAYGRYDQARELLEAGVARDPSRQDLRFKLLTACVEQGDWPAAERDAEWLRESGDPVLLPEVERLMARRGPHDDRGPHEEEAEEAPSDERPSPAEGDVPVRHDVPRSPQAVQGDSPGDGASLPSDRETRDDSVGAQDALSAANPAEREESASNMIDYQPPALDPEPASRQETPMQPSVEFTSVQDVPPVEDERLAEEVPLAGLGSELDPQHAKGAPLGEGTAQPGDDWDVEEVAFPPLDVDNGQPFNADVSDDSLQEAHRLIEAEESDRARVVLQQVIAETQDPQLRDKARELLDQHQL